MADTKARGIQLIRTDDTTPGVVKFYDRRETDAKKAFIGQVDVAKMPAATRTAYAVHGVTQNMLDSSNKLEGDARVAYIKTTCAQVESGTWASAPVDQAKLKQNAIDAIRKLVNIDAALREQMIKNLG